MRNFEISSDNSKKTSNCSDRWRGVSEEEEKESEDRDSDLSIEGLDRIGLQVFGDLSPEALDYIQRLQSELSNAKEVSVLLCTSHNLRIVGNWMRNPEKRNFWKSFFEIRPLRGEN
jgi:hypothetical protein